jgi:hypothetical protein
MFYKLNNEKVPVLYKITKFSKEGWGYFRLDSDEYSLFPTEKEVLFRTGSLFDIIDISEEVHESNGIKYILV